VRVTVDTEDDLLFMQHVASRLNGWSEEPELRHIVAVATLVTAGVQCA
jgi:spore coat polysaccharide biosynthesis protein SpsF (cytidylyltransferase family)